MSEIFQIKFFVFQAKKNSKVGCFKSLRSNPIKVFVLVMGETRKVTCFRSPLFLAKKFSFWEEGKIQKVECCILGGKISKTSEISHLPKLSTWRFCDESECAVIQKKFESDS